MVTQVPRLVNDSNQVHRPHPLGRLGLLRGAPAPRLHEALLRTGCGLAEQVIALLEEPRRKRGPRSSLWPRRHHLVHGPVSRFVILLRELVHLLRIQAHLPRRRRRGGRHACCDERVAHQRVHAADCFYSILKPCTSRFLPPSAPSMNSKIFHATFNHFEMSEPRGACRGRAV